MRSKKAVAALSLVLLSVLLITCKSTSEKAFEPKFKLVDAPKVLFNSFVDCNMAEAWIGDTFRIFPGKYGEDPVWGPARELHFANGQNADEAFNRSLEEFVDPIMPPNAPPGTAGLHGAVWFETVYQDVNDKSGKTIYAVYHNEN